MSLYSRFFGRKDTGDLTDGQLLANPDIQKPLSLQVLFPETCPLDAPQLIGAFRSHHRSMSDVQCEIDPALIREGKLLGIIGWGKHVIRLVGFDAPFPATAFEACVAPSHYHQELKQRARSHKAHVILYYAGHESSPFEQYVALGAAAGAMARLGAIVVLNEAGHTSFSAAVLWDSQFGDALDLLRGLPLLILFCGFVKYDVQGTPGVWMRTYGAPLLGLPDLAAHAAGHQEGQRYFDMFENILGYLRESGALLAAGHTMQVGEAEHIRLRAATPEEWFLESAELLVVEMIGANEVNR